jgi:hypothetical protein
MVYVLVTMTVLYVSDTEVTFLDGVTYEQWTLARGDVHADLDAGDICEFTIEADGRVKFCRRVGRILRDRQRALKIHPKKSLKTLTT